MVAGAGVADPADVRTPGAEIETAFVVEVESALERGFPVRLGQATENVLAVDAEITGQRIGRLGGLGFCGGRGVPVFSVWASAAPTSAIAAAARSVEARSFLMVMAGPLAGEFVAKQRIVSTRHARHKVLLFNRLCCDNPRDYCCAAAKQSTIFVHHAGAPAHPWGGRNRGFANLRGSRNVPVW